MSNLLPVLAAKRIQRSWRHYALQKERMEDANILSAFLSVAFMQAFSMVVSFCV